MRDFEWRIWRMVMHGADGRSTLKGSKRKDDDDDDDCHNGNDVTLTMIKHEIS